jgi:hypothetical protein
VPPKRYQLPPFEDIQAHESRYEALSYAWGPQGSFSKILVCAPDGAAATASILSIGPALKIALRHLRYADRPRRLWVDAVCINQMDNEEKDSQVKRMAEIYRQAGRVMVWLGPASYVENSALAMSAIRFLGSQVVYGQRQPFLLLRPRRNGATLREPKHYPALH